MDAISWLILTLACLLWVFYFALAIFTFHRGRQHRKHVKELKRHFLAHKRSKA